MPDYAIAGGHAAKVFKNVMLSTHTATELEQKLFLRIEYMFRNAVNSLILLESGY